MRLTTRYASVRGWPGRLAVELVARKVSLASLRGMPPDSFDHVTKARRATEDSVEVGMIHEKKGRAFPRGPGDRN